MVIVQPLQKLEFYLCPKKKKMSIIFFFLQFYRKLQETRETDNHLKNLKLQVMQQSFVTSAPPPTEKGGDYDF